MKQRVEIKGKMRDRGTDSNLTGATRSSDSCINGPLGELVMLTNFVFDFNYISKNSPFKYFETSDTLSQQ